MIENRDYLFQIDEDSIGATEGIAGLEALKTGLANQFYERALLSEATMAAEKAQLESVPLVTNEGNYYPKAVISAEAYHWWGQRIGYECWEDKDFVDGFLRDNPESRVNAPMAKTTILNQWGQPAAA